MLFGDQESGAGQIILGCPLLPSGWGIDPPHPSRLRVGILEQGFSLTPIPAPMKTHTLKSKTAVLTGMAADQVVEKVLAIMTTRERILKVSRQCQATLSRHRSVQTVLGLCICVFVYFE